MKSCKTGVVLLLLGVLWFWGSQVSAQPFPGGRDLPPRSPAGKTMQGFHGLAAGLKLIIDLDLSAEQVTKMVMLFKEHHTARTTQEKQMREQDKAFRESFDPGSYDEGKSRAFAAGQAKIMEELTFQRYKFVASLFALLTPDQRVKVAPMIEQFKKMGHPGHGGGKAIKGGNRFGFDLQRKFGRVNNPEGGHPPFPFGK